jgi:hypothetical protein
VPKNEIQYRSRARSIKNFTSSFILDDKAAYKRFYFVDWPILNRHKCHIFPHIDIYVDDQRFKHPVYMHANDLRSSLAELNRSVIRPRPWFETGVWGGTWMRTHIKDLPKDTVNYAWSFELIAPENGVLLIDDQRKLLEFSFDLLMYFDNVKLMGTQQFGYEFPIRFDFLDTFDGQNLSIQCHAGQEYLEKNFCETMPQDESYYIVDAKEDARVYLGFQENISREDFKWV